MIGNDLLSSLPGELIAHIASFTASSHGNSEEIKRAARSLTSISQTNCKISLLCKPLLASMKNEYKKVRTEELLAKYFAYPYLQGSIGDVGPFVPGALFDALMSGCTLPYANHSHRYSPETEKDIEELVELLPCSLKWNYGVLRCRNNLSPLGAALANVIIPVNIVKLLLENGADPEQKISVNGFETCVLKCLNDDGSNRSESIKELFKDFEQPEKK